MTVLTTADTVWLFATFMLVFVTGGLLGFWLGEDRAERRLEKHDR